MRGAATARLGSAVALMLLVSLAITGCEPARPVGSYSSTGPMKVGRHNHTATLLNDGRVLVTGGISTERPSGTRYTYTDTYLASAELYDHAAGAFSLTGSMTAPRAGHTATLLDDGRVLIAGGNAEPGSSVVASAELYDPATGTFIPTGSMITPRSGHTATLLNDGRVLITGGYGVSELASAELYDPKTGHFTATGSMSTPRLGNAATLLFDGRVLVAGGHVGTMYVPGFDSAELYDPTTSSFSPTGSMTETRAVLTGTLLHDGRVFIAEDMERNPDLYDPKTGTFTRTQPMPSDGVGGTATLLPDGRVLVAGSNLCAADACWYPQLFDPGSNSFSEANAMPNKYAAMTLLKDGRVLFTGGTCCESDTSAGLYRP